MTCEQVQALLEVAQPLAPDQQAAVDAHLPRCAACRAVAETEARLRSAVAATRTIRPSRQLEQALLAVPRRERRRRALIPLLVPLAGMVCLLSTAVLWLAAPDGLAPGRARATASAQPAAQRPSTAAATDGSPFRPAEAMGGTATPVARPGVQLVTPPRRATQLALRPATTSTLPAVSGTPAASSASGSSRAPRPSATGLVGGGAWTATPAPTATDADQGLVAPATPPTATPPGTDPFPSPPLPPAVSPTTPPPGTTPTPEAGPTMPTPTGRSPATRTVPPATATPLPTRGPGAPTGTRPPPTSPPLPPPTATPGPTASATFVVTGTASVTASPTSTPTATPTSTPTGTP